MSAALRTIPPPLRGGKVFGGSWDHGLRPPSAGSTRGYNRPPLRGGHKCGVLGLVLLGAINLLGTGRAVGQSGGDEVDKAFLKHVAQRAEVDAQTKAFIEKAWGERSADAAPQDFLLEALAVLSPRFRDGLDLYDDGAFDKAFEVMEALSSDADPFVAANARVFAIKCLVEQERLDEASARITAVLADTTSVDLYSHFASEVAFLSGYTALRNLEYDRAEKALQGMLRLFPNAPDRLRVTAGQMLAELRRREPEKLGDVADLMAFAGRRLEHQVTNESVQTRQQHAIDLLDKLIEEAEQAEQNSSSSSGSSGGNNQKSPSSPMPDSSLPGGSSGGPENLRTTRHIKPGEVWGSMPPAEREKILQSLRDSFPSRYRQLVEQYYQELSKQP